MDPLAIAGSIVGTTAACLRVTKSLSSLQTKYKNANLIIVAICSESSVISASLSQLQNLFTDTTSDVAARFRTRPELAAACDTALTGCMLLYTCLEDEVGLLNAAAQKPGGLDWTERAKIVWKEDEMVDLLEQIRGQEAALTLLLQGLQMESIPDIRRLLRENRDTLDVIVANTDGLRNSYPSNHVPDSIFDENRTALSVFGTMNSIVGEEEFSFDDMVINSNAYRRAMTLAQAQITHVSKTITAAIEGDLIDLSIPDVIEDVPPMETQKALGDLKLLADSASENTVQSPPTQDVSLDPIPVVSPENTDQLQPTQDLPLQSSPAKFPPVTSSAWKAPYSWHFADTSLRGLPHITAW
ncbi:hypothetical protein EJ08DRAFT_379081 [Tothia fuscella]|uniref:Fungal N-terminal domain-containing protein n=1 Tax=Tothia fuscella TaxID=1048955 RepID=A0A9P4NL40_9PEZI|nr:hypothetical protein EJ08DRAFT_379081 [Tothia fuscella]